MGGGYADYQQARERAAESDVLLINPIIFSEVSVHFSRIEDLEAALPRENFKREALPWQAGSLAAKCFMMYRKRGGERRSPLPDFYIGAHALRAAAGSRRMPLRDRYRCNHLHRWRIAGSQAQRPFVRCRPRLSQIYAHDCRNCLDDRLPTKSCRPESEERRRSPCPASFASPPCHRGAA